MKKNATALLREHDLLDTAENILIKKRNITVEDYILNSDQPASSKGSDAELHSGRNHRRKIDKPTELGFFSLKVVRTTNVFVIFEETKHITANYSARCKAMLSFRRIGGL